MKKGKYLIAKIIPKPGETIEEKKIPIKVKAHIENYSIFGIKILSKVEYLKELEVE